MLRVIPRLDIKGPDLVKGVQMEGLRVLGSPEEFADRYYREGADELLYMDVVASLYNRNGLVEFVRRVSKKIFVPLIVGGGVRTIEDIRTLLRSGADKVAINTAAVHNEEFVRVAAQTFGSSTVVASIEAARRPDGTYEAFTDNGREGSGKNALAWAERAATLGAGEILVTSIDREGTGTGFDLELVRAVADRVSVPVIAGGGAGSVEHVVDVAKEGRVEGVALASLLHYDLIRRENVESGGAAGNTQFLKSGGRFTQFAAAGLRELKEGLESHGVVCRRYGVSVQ